MPLSPDFRPLFWRAMLSFHALPAVTRLSGTQNQTKQVSYSLISLPLYAVEEISRMSSQARDEAC